MLNIRRARHFAGYARAFRPERVSSRWCHGMANLRNVGVVAHVDAGKTTTTENMLYLCGTIDSIGRVDSGDTVTDFLPMERERGITIQSAAISMGWKGHRINLIDTPGHVDFTVEVERAVRVLDGAVVVLDAVAGVQAQTRTVWRQVQRQNIPTVAFVNKMDRVGADFTAAVASMRGKLDINTLPLQYPILGEHGKFLGYVDLLTLTKYEWADDVPRSDPVVSQVEDVGEVAEARAAMFDTLSAADDLFLEEYMTYLEQEDEGGSVPSLDNILGALRRATVSNLLVPVFCGSSLKSRGVEHVLDAVVSFLPSPADRRPSRLKDKFSGAEKTIAPSSKHLTALAFKVTKHATRGTLTFVRTYSGVLQTGASLYNPTRGKRERPQQVLEVSADELSMLDSVPTGHVACLVGLKHTRTGDTLVADKGPLKTMELDGLAVPADVFSLAVEPEFASQQADLEAALEILQLEDPSLRVHVDEESGQTLLCGIGELHLEVVCDKLRTTHKVPIETGQTYIAYRETLQETDPLPRTFTLDRTLGQKQMHATMQYVISSSCSGAPSEVVLSESLRRALRPEEGDAVRTGLEGALTRGPQGYPITGVRVEVTDVVQESAGRDPGVLLACATALVDAEMRHEDRHVLLEPLMAVEITIPEEFVGEVLGELNSRRPHIREVVAEEHFHRILASIPVANMLGYATTIRSLTQGGGSFSMELEDYGIKTY